MIRLVAVATSGMTLASGLSLAIVPASVLSISASLFDLSEQGVVAVAIMTATFVGQLVVAATVESRLSTLTSNRRVAVPMWLGVLAVSASMVVAIAPANAVVLAIALPFMLAGLETARAVSIAERRDRHEWVAATLVGAGAATSVIAGLLDQSWALTPLAASVGLAIVIRMTRPRTDSSMPNPRVRRWVLADAGVTGVIYPLMNAAVLALMGAEQAVQFTAIATVSGALAIPLNFLRARLLREHSPIDTAISAGAVLLAVAVIVVADLFGLLGLVFGEAWSSADLAGPLWIAFAWRAASLATTLPFAALRRAGAVSLVMVLRAAISLITLALALVAVSGGSLLVLFAALLTAELLSAAVYQIAWRRVSRRALVNDGELE